MNEPITNYIQRLEQEGFSGTLLLRFDKGRVNQLSFQTVITPESLEEHKTLRTKYDANNKR